MICHQEQWRESRFGGAVVGVRPRAWCGIGRWAKAAEDCRTPGRFARFGCVGRCASLWIALVPWRFFDWAMAGESIWRCRYWRKTPGLELDCAIGKSGRGLPHFRTLRAVRMRWEVRQHMECASPLSPLAEKTPARHCGLNQALYGECWVAFE